MRTSTARRSDEGPTGASLEPLPPIGRDASTPLLGVLTPRDTERSDAVFCTGVMLLPEPDDWLLMRFCVRTRREYSAMRNPRIRVNVIRSETGA